MKNQRHELAVQINNLLTKFRHFQGWSIDDLANFLEINNLTVRNSLSRNKWSDLAVTILKLKKVIPETLAYEYKKEIEREKIKNRKKGWEELG